MANEVQYGGLQFEEASRFFRDKVRLPTKTWGDLQHGMHARAFVVAGATKDALLADFQTAVRRAIDDGVTIETFRKDFDAIVARHGWEYNGGRNWRSRVIFDTNVRTAYAAGRHAQMTDPDTLKRRPFWEYRHGDSIVPRPAHLAWNGLVLAADDPWWQTHYPPNGWGCKCKVFSRSKRDLAKLGKDGADTAPEIAWEEKPLGRHPGAPVVRVPKGIDPGWGYNVGEAAWGRNEAKRLMEEVRIDEKSPWMAIDPRGPANYNREPKVPPDSPRAKLGLRVEKGDEAGLRAALTKAIGGERAEFVDPTGATQAVTQAIADHQIEDPANRWDGREAYFPFIPELIKDPYEIWVNFVRNEHSGRVLLRKRYVKSLSLGGNRTIGLIADVVRGQWAGLTIYRSERSTAAGLRNGRLIYGRE